MTENKYYTPEISEFHIGFRYEAKNNETFEWEKVIQISGFAGSEHYDRDLINLANDQFRVKCLDKQDIEELGWEYVGESNYYKGDIRYRIKNKGNTWLWLNVARQGDYQILISSFDTGFSLEGDSFLFDGDIKNYNELKKLMLMLEIEKI